MRISIISPVYNVEGILDELINQIISEISKISEDYELILVEDGSSDNSWRKIDDHCSKNKNIKGIKLSRNFGQHYAIAAGIKNCTGDVAILMDCDLQDDPIYFKLFLNEYSQGYEIVFSKKKRRKHSVIKNIFASCYNYIFNYLSDDVGWKITIYVSTFGLLSRKAIDAYLEIKDYSRHTLTVLRWIGFSHTFVDVEHKERYLGKSTYNFSKLVNHAIDGIISQTDKLLRLTIYLGIALSFFSFTGIGYILIKSINSSFKAGWPSLFVLILFVSGMIILTIGVSAIYIGKIYEQTKERPLFIVDKKINI